MLVFLSISLLLLVTPSHATLTTPTIASTVLFNTSHPLQASNAVCPFVIYDEAANLVYALNTDDNYTYLEVMSFDASNGKLEFLNEVLLTYSPPGGFIMSFITPLPQVAAIAIAYILSDKTELTYFISVNATNGTELLYDFKFGIWELQNVITDDVSSEYYGAVYASPSAYYVSLNFYFYPFTGGHYPGFVNSSIPVPFFEVLVVPGITYINRNTGPIRS